MVHLGQAVLDVFDINVVIATVIVAGSVQLAVDDVLPFCATYSGQLKLDDDAEGDHSHEEPVGFAGENHVQRNEKQFHKFSFLSSKLLIIYYFKHISF